MKADDARAKWHPIDPAALQAITNCSATPGLVFPVGTNALPQQIQQMPGLVSYFVSSYQAPMVLANNLTAGGELAVVRTDGELGKAYNYVFATSSNGFVVYNGPHKCFPQHHFSSSAPVPVEQLFNHVSFTTKSKP
jgi:hypothetical protein